MVRLILVLDAALHVGRATVRAARAIRPTQLLILNPCMGVLLLGKGLCHLQQRRTLTLQLSRRLAHAGLSWCDLEVIHATP